MAKFEGLPKLKQNIKKLSPLIGALALGILAAGLGWYYLKSSEQEIAANLARNADSKRRTVIVAAEGLRGGTVVTSDMVALRPMPIEYIHADALTPDNFDDYAGQQLLVAVEPGKPLLAAFFSEKRKVFSEQIEAGVRAITIPVDEISSISGMLRAGDRIDFMYMVEKQATGESETLVVPLLQDIEVRATGQITADEFAAKRNRPTIAATDDPYAQQRYSTVTVAIPPKDAQKLILAQRMGKIVAALRNPIDRDTLQSGTDASDLAAAVNSFRPARETGTVVSLPGIEYIIGGAGNSGAGSLGTTGGAPSEAPGRGSAGGVPMPDLESAIPQTE